MKNSSTIWTAEQLKAITTAGRDVLVTSSAGTGKTAVLSARCIELLSRGDDPADITEFLIMTFTEASAEEMKSRIGDQLRELGGEVAGMSCQRQPTGCGTFSQAINELIHKLTECLNLLEIQAPVFGRDEWLNRETWEQPGNQAHLEVGTRQLSVRFVT